MLSIFVFFLLSFSWWVLLVLKGCEDGEILIQVPDHFQMVACISSLPSLQSRPSTRERPRPKSFLGDLEFLILSVG